MASLSGEALVPGFLRPPDNRVDFFTPKITQQWPILDARPFQKIYPAPESILPSCGAPAARADAQNRLQHLLNELQHSAVGDLLSDEGQELFVIYGSKKVFEIRIDDPLTSGLHFTPDLGQGIGCLATLTIPKAATGGAERRGRGQSSSDAPETLVSQKCTASPGSAA